MTTVHNAGKIYEQPLTGAFCRFLELQPGSGTDALICHLQVTELRDGLPAPFEAVSYTWGSSERTHEIICNEETMKVTRNIANVLRMLRLPDRPRLLWADSICINQDNATERNHQVGLMGKIYRSAKRVLICLGWHNDELEHAKRAMSLAEDVSAMIVAEVEQLNGSHNGEVPWDSFPHPENSNSLLSDERWKSYDAMLRQPWFTRGWVVQEAALAATAVVIWCGYQTGWEQVLRVHTWVVRRTELPLKLGVATIRELHGEFYKQRMLKTETRALYTERGSLNPSHDLLDYLHYGRNFAFAVKHDRIYGMMGLTDSPYKSVDYKKPFLEVYTSLAVAMLPRWGVAILNYIEHDDTSLDEAPSWVPRWDFRNTEMINRDQMLPAPKPSATNAENIYQPGPVKHAAGLLTVRGVIIDTVAFKSASLETGSTMQDTVRDLLQHNGAKASDNYYQAHTILSTILSSIEQGQNPVGAGITWTAHRAAFALSALGGHRNISQSTLKSLEREAPAGSADAYRYYTAVQLHGRAFIVTKRGIHGTAPYRVQEGDKCAIIFGMVNPVILRPTGNDCRYKIVGNAWLASKVSAYIVGGKKDDETWCCMFPLGWANSQDWVEWATEEDIVLV